MPCVGSSSKKPKHSLAVHITAVGITTRNANSDSGIIAEFSLQIGTAKRTSKCIRILSNINSKKGFFYFSHPNVPDIRQSVSSAVAHVPAWRGAVGPVVHHVVVQLGFNCRRGQLSIFFWSLERCLNWECRFALCILSRFVAFSGRWDINRHIKSYFQETSFLCSYKTCLLICKIEVNNPIISIVVYASVTIETIRHLSLKINASFWTYFPYCK